MEFKWPPQQWVFGQILSIKPELPRTEWALRPIRKVLVTIAPLGTHAGHCCSGGRHSWIGLLAELSVLAAATAPFGAIRASPQREGFQVSPSFIPSMCPNNVVSLATRI